MDMNGNIIYAVDFDGTLSLGAKWPKQGPKHTNQHYSPEHKEKEI